MTKKLTFTSILFYFLLLYSETMLFIRVIIMLKFKPFVLYLVVCCTLFIPLQLHAISERFKMACPSTETQDQMYDFSHILDFCSQVRSLSIEGSYEKLGTSNIIPNELQFDLIAFKSLVDLKILGVPMGCIQSVGMYFDLYLLFL